MRAGQSDVQLREVSSPETVRTFIVWGLRTILWWLWFPLALITYPVAAGAEAVAAIREGRASQASFGRYIQWLEAWVVAVLCRAVLLHLTNRPRLWSTEDGAFTWKHVH